MNVVVVAYVAFFAVVGMIGLVVVAFVLSAFAFALLRWVTEVVKGRNGLVD
jgi:hypothetical protein